MWILWMFVFLHLLSVSYRIENNHIVSLRIDTYRIVWWPYRLIPTKKVMFSIILWQVHDTYTYIVAYMWIYYDTITITAPDCPWKRPYAGSGSLWTLSLPTGQRSRNPSAYNDTQRTECFLQHVIIFCYWVIHSC